jgi:Ca2+-binding EF-hand superfamily protein
MTALHMPGRVLEDAINNLRRKARKDPPESAAGYLQHFDKIDFDEENRKIVKIQGEVFDPYRLYLVELPAKFFSGIDNPFPLLEWATENKLTVEEGNGMPAKVVIVETFAALLWLKMGSFETIDKDGDGILTRDEVRSRAMEIFGDDVADLVVDSVFGVADLNNTGVITPVDMAVVQFVASDMLDHIATGEELAAMRMVASEVLGKRPSHIDVRKVVGELKNVLDMDKDGKIRREEAMKAIGEVRRRSLLI